MTSALQEIIDVLTTVAVGIFTALIMTSVFIFVLVYKRNRNFYKRYFWNPLKSNKKSEVTLIKPISNSVYNSETELGFANFQTSGNFEKILEDEKWLNDVSDVIPHCLGILKNCRSLTEKLSTLCMGMMNTNGPGMKQIVDCARQISSRIDGMVSTMYPPLNTELLEARATALMLAVTQLAIIARYEGGLRKIPMDWMDSSLQDIETHLNFLRESTSSQEMIKTDEMEKTVSIINF